MSAPSSRDRLHPRRGLWVPETLPRSFRKPWPRLSRPDGRRPTLPWTATLSPSSSSSSSFSRVAENRSHRVTRSVATRSSGA